MRRLTIDWAKLLYFAPMPQNKFQKAVFLDRDGVINHDPGDYTKSVDEFTVLPGVVESMLKWQQDGFGLIVITNQGGLAKGLYTEDDLHAMHQYFQGICALQGVVVDAFYYCPHHSDFHKCLCRKPGSLLIEKALHHFQLNPQDCVMIGDKQRDMDAAAGAGVKGILIKTNAGLYPGLIDEPAA